MLISNPLKKVLQNLYKKVISIKVQKLCTFSSFRTVYKSSQPSYFLCVNFLDPFLTVRNQHQILRFLIPILKLFGKKFLGSYQHFLHTYKPNAPEKAQNIEKFFMCHRIQFCIHVWVRTFNFFQKQSKPLQLYGADPHPHPSTTINIYQRVNIYRQFCI